MNAYEKSIALGLTGTDAEQVAILQSITRGPISVANVIQYFDEQDLGELDPIDNAWTGTLVDIIRNDQMPLELRSGLRDLFKHLAKRTSETVDTTDPTVALQTATLLGVLIQIGIITTEQRDAFYALDSGRPYKELTVEQFSQQQTEAEAVAAKVAIVDAGREVIRPIQQRVTAATAWLDAIDVSRYTMEELTARVTAIVTCDDGNPPSEGE